MPASSPHIAIANRNQSTLAYLMERAEDHPEWITTVAFYKALHIVEAVFEQQSLTHGRNHESRDSLLKKHRQFDEILRQYRPLWAASTVARYLTSPDGSSHSSFSRYLPPEKVVGKIVHHYLHRIEESAFRFLDENCGLVRCG